MIDGGDDELVDLRLPASIEGKLADFASMRGISVESFIREAIAEKIASARQFDRQEQKTKRVKPFKLIRRRKHIN